jgi:hypothetical protein
LNHDLNFSNQLTISKVNWDTVASLTGYNKGSTASVRFSQLMRQAKAANPNLTTADGAGEGSGLGTNVTPSKIIKSRARKPKAAGTPRKRTVTKKSELPVSDTEEAEEVGAIMKEEVEDEEAGVYFEVEEEMK